MEEVAGGGLAQAGRETSFIIQHVFTERVLQDRHYSGFMGVIHISFSALVGFR